MKERTGRRLRRGAFLLPSAFTVGNMLLGFYAIIAGYRGRYELAGICILIAAVLDTLDGKLARITGTESDFGRELDSLADVVTFGAAPALVAHFWGLQELPRAGWLIPLFYLAATATRLARFNVQTTHSDTRYFVGLPSPAAAGVVATFLIVAPPPSWRPWLIALVTLGLVGLGVLMVSTFRYWSLKQVDLSRRWSFRIVLPIAGVVLLLGFHPRSTLPVLAVAYALSGPALWLVGRLFARHPDAPAAPR